jgi:hypothetical protein
MPGRGGDSARRINKLLAARPGETRYLEIGVWQGGTLESVCATERWGVEPTPQFDAPTVPAGVTIHVCTSDVFFSTLDADVQFDVVFLDGLHTYAQTYRDLINALRVCPSGFVLIDDVVPADSDSAHPDRQYARRAAKLAGRPPIWHGDVFKAVIAMSRYHSDQLDFCTIVDTGNPQTVVWRKSPGEAVPPRDPSRLAELDDMTFAQVFESGVPDFFNPMAEDPAIARAISGGRVR